jgi:hypothetical protein
VIETLVRDRLKEKISSRHAYVTFRVYIPEEDYRKKHVRKSRKDTSPGKNRTAINVRSRGIRKQKIESRR